MKSKLWKKFKGKSVKLLIEDIPFPRQKTGVIVDVDDTHLFLEIDLPDKPKEIKPFLLTSIKRIDIQNE